MVIYCCNCEKESVCSPVTGHNVYKGRPDLYHLKFFRCNGCGKYVGTHKGSGLPLGVIPTAGMRAKRSQLHSLLDPIWRNGRVGRKNLYFEISKRLGKEFYVGETRSKGEIDEAMDVVRAIRKELGMPRKEKLK